VWWGDENRGRAGDTLEEVKRRRLAAWVIAGGTCVACASLDGLTGGVPGKPAEGGVPEAAVVTVDGSTPVDAATEAALDAGSRFCRGVDAAFCADFDEGPLGTDWNEVVITGGILELDSTLVRSKPNALHMGVADGGADGFLRKALPLDANAIRITADINHSCTSMTGGQFTVLELRCTGSDGQRGGAAFMLSSFGPHKLTTTRVGLGPTKFEMFDVPVPPEVWRSLSIDTTFGTPGTLAVRVDGVEVVSAKPVFGCQSTAALDLVVGLNGGTGTPCMVNVDNVVLER
jgi:hypothetical protein